MLAQDSLLFPHLSVHENVAFGPRSAGVGRSAASVTAFRWLEEVGALEFADRRPAQLSGGQAQRVALARALASNPDLLLLDEPMAALDITVASTLRRMLKRVLSGRTAIIVTHDLLDALLLADYVIVLDGGHIVEQGRTRDVLTNPRSRFTADIAGLNLLTGIRTARGFITAAGLELTAGGRPVPVAAETDFGGPEPIPVAHEAVPVNAALGQTARGEAVAAAIRPSNVGIAAGTATNGVNSFTATVQDIEPRGDLVRVRCEHLSADITPADLADLDLSPGDIATFTIPPGHLALYPA